MARYSGHVSPLISTLTLLLAAGVIGALCLNLPRSAEPGMSPASLAWLPSVYVTIIGSILIVLMLLVRVCVREMQSERKQSQSLFESLAEGVVIHDSSGRIIQCNHQAGEILGLTRDQLLGKRSVDPEWQSVHEDGSLWPGSEHPAMVTLRTGQSIRNAIMGIRTGNGHQRWLTINSQAVLDSDGRPSMAVVSFADVTHTRQQMARLDLTISGAGLGTWDWNIVTGEVVFNDIWARMLGYELSEIEPNVNSWKKIVDPVAAREIMSQLNEHLEGHTPIYRSEHRLRRKDGSWMWVLDTGRVVERDANGQPLRALGVHVDITQTKEMEQRLRQSDQQFLAIFDQTAHLLWVLSPGGLIHKANQAALHFSGANPISLIGHPFSDSAWLCRALNQPQIMSSAINQAAAGDFVRFELAIYSPDDSTYRAPFCTFDFSIKPVFEGEQVISLVAEALDITEAVRTREGLHLAQDRLDNATRNAHLGVWDWNPQTDEAWFSEQYFSMLGFNAYDFAHTGETWLALLHPQDVAAVVKELRRYLDGDRADTTEEFRLEFRMRHRDGSWRSILSVGRVTGRDALGAAQRVSGVHFDETERKQMQSQRAQAQRLESIGQLAAGVAHEINTPMQFVSDNLEYLVEGLESAEQVIERLEHLVAQANSGSLVIDTCWLPETLRQTGYARFRKECSGAVRDCRDGCQRVVNIVHAMRQLSHPGTDSFQHANLNEIINGAAVITRNRWKFVADVQLELASDLPLVPCRAAELSQVFVNILVNAADAMEVPPAGSGQLHGQIVVRTEIQEQCVRATVTDNGSGISPDVIEHIFDPFFTTKPVGQGTGQGLAIAHDIVANRHRGVLRVESEPGGGTCFIIELPLVQESLVAPLITA